ncbi:MAG: methylenetetrahydrofolate reductase [Frankiales bacterium]|nr:methylenetetrahydrofolate reductase [Frankiales bacterium]
MPVTDCPKRMTYGPCGGVRHDLRCEMAPHRCVFVDAPAQVWDGELAAPLGLTAPYVLTDLSVRPFDVTGLHEVVDVLRGTCDAVLVGEHQHRPDFPPGQMTSLVHDAGLVAWITLTCRDRNRVVLEQELAGLALGGTRPAGVLCVTGDGRAPGTRPEVTQVFDLDSTRLAALAADRGLPVAVAESPGAEPREVRPLRVLSKQRAGANVCFLNHVGTPQAVSAFIRSCRDLGVTLPFVAGVAVYTDERSARVLQAFPGLDLDEGRVQQVLRASDQEEAGIGAAVHEAQQLLAVDGVVGVNLSGLASGAGEVPAARIKAEVGRRVRG